MPSRPRAEDLPELFNQADSGTAAGIEKLALALLAIDRSNDAELKEAATAGLVGLSARAWLALDTTTRRSWWHAPAWSKTVSDRLRGRGPGPLGLVVGTFHPDGHVREAYVARITELNDVVLTTALAVRTADWVSQVRDRARVGMELRLLEGSGDVLLAAAPVALTMRARREATWLAERIEDRLREGSEAELQAALAARDWRTRRAAYEAAIEKKKLPLAALVQAATRDRDLPIRTRCARAAVALALEEGTPDALRPLLEGGTALVRGEAVTALAKAGEVAAAQAALDDQSSIVRWCAQVAIRLAGGDPAEHYRQRLRLEPPSPARVAGLGETGSTSDIETLAAWLGYPKARVRAEAVRALRKLGEATPDRILHLLADPSAAVTRQVVRALTSHARALDGDLLHALLEIGHPRHVRVGAYRLVRQRDTWIRLATDLRLLLDHETALSTRAGADIEFWLRREAATAYKQPSGALAAELDSLITSAEPSLGHRATKDLRFHLGLQRRQ